MSFSDGIFLGVIFGVLICALSAWLYGCPSARFRAASVAACATAVGDYPQMPACRPPRQRTSEDFARDELERLHGFLTGAIDNEWSVEATIGFARAQLDQAEAELKKLRIPQPSDARTMGH